MAARGSRDLKTSLRWLHDVVVTRWSRSTQLLYTGHGYYLDGLLSADGQTISLRTQPPRSTQPRVPACLVGVRQAGRVHLSRVIPYGKLHPVALRRLVQESYIV